MTVNRGALREALLAVLNCVEDEPEAYEACERLCAALQVSREDGFDGIADALLALPPQGEPWAWGVVPANGVRAVYEVSTDKDHAQAMADTRNSPNVARQLPPEHIPYRVVALYAAIPDASPSTPPTQEPAP